MTRSALTALMCAGILGAGVLVSAPATAAPAGTAPTAGTELSGKTVFLDPGHQGTAHSENLQRQVDDGRGGTKDCQTTGMTTLDGVPEHTINWKVSELVRSSLESLGATVKTSRADDTGWGGCVDDRARAASESGADVAVSIHADSTSATTDADKHGFHLIVPTLPIPSAAADAAQSERGRSASTLMRDSYVRAGFEPANYAGVENGRRARADHGAPRVRRDGQRIQPRRRSSSRELGRSARACDRHLDGNHRLPARGRNPVHDSGHRHHACGHHDCDNRRPRPDGTQRRRPRDRGA